MLPLIHVDNLSAAEVWGLLDNAEALRLGAAPASGPSGRSVALVFFEPSLRTRVGFSVAAHRLGLQTVEVYEPRASAVSMPESWEDTLRTVAGYSDLVIGRPGVPLDREIVAFMCSRFISGGDTGPRAEHPTQALVDVFAMRSLGRWEGATVVLWGDPRMRAARSLLKLLRKISECRIAVVTDPSMVDESVNEESQFGRLELADPHQLAALEPDYLYVIGMPHNSLPLDQREALIVDEFTLAKLKSDSVVLSPLPVIDEIHRSARSDPRVRMFEQSDLGLYMRMALLQHALREK